MRTQSNSSCAISGAVRTLRGCSPTSVRHADIFRLAAASAHLWHGPETQPTKDAVIKPAKAAIITGVVREERRLRFAIVTLQDVIVSGEDRPHQRLRGQLAAARSVEPAAAIRLSARLARMLRSDDV
jgi:hypothetical protein